MLMRNYTMQNVARLLLGVCLALLMPVLFAQSDDEFLKIKADIELEKNSNEKILSECRELLQRHKNCLDIPEAEERLRETLRINQEYNRLQVSLVEAEERQARLATRVNRLLNINEEETELPQQAQQRGQWLQEVESLGNTQRELRETLRSRQANLERILAQLPPPPKFTLECGLEMVLVKGNPRNGEMFYISNGPVTKKVYASVMSLDGEAEDAPKGDVSFWEAMRFCQELNKKAGRGYGFRLLRAAEVKRLTALELMSEMAIWVDIPWGEKLSEDIDMQERFGVKMMTVWDPAACLTAEAEESALYKELPDSRYAKLGFVVVASWQSGWQQRFDRLQQEVTREN